MISKIIIAMLHDVHRMHGSKFNSRALKLTIEKVNSRIRSEGPSFLTKTLPRLGKALDKALCDHSPLNATALRFSTYGDTNLPRFLGEFFSRVFDSDGVVLPKPCVDSVQVLREVLYKFYKYKLPWTAEQEHTVLSKFERTEEDLVLSDRVILSIGDQIASEGLQYVSRSDRGCYKACSARTRRDYTKPVNCRRLTTGLCSDKSVARKREVYRNEPTDSHRLVYLAAVARKAKHLLSDVFSLFDPKDIYPRHGPGAVATRQRLWDKYLWTNVSASITKLYSLDEFFFVSLTHVCDALSSLQKITEVDSPARVILVQKDSRGPRLISAESVDKQWIQQGLGQAIRELVEEHELTKFNVHFTSQQPNQLGALVGSLTGSYSTLDLNEASDRVSVELVRLLFPPHLVGYLECCRSSATELPDGRILKLNKFAPMGSNLCFPILALTVWAILAAGATDTDTRESILVYGDDVIVPTGYTRDAIELLESFGLKINQDKSCIKGFFRESCGVDAFRGIDVTPLRLRTVWSSTRSADVYSSYVAYANEFWDRHYVSTYELIVSELTAVYGPIPGKDMALPCPSLANVADTTSIRRRSNSGLQCSEYQCFDVSTPSITHEIDGWSQLLRFFAERANGHNMRDRDERVFQSNSEDSPFSVSTYTKRGTAKLRRRWLRPVTLDCIQRREVLNYPIDFFSRYHACDDLDKTQPLNKVVSGSS